MASETDEERAAREERIRQLPAYLRPKGDEPASVPTPEPERKLPTWAAMMMLAMGIALVALGYVSMTTRAVPEDLAASFCREAEAVEVRAWWRRSCAMGNDSACDTRDLQRELCTD